MKAKLDQKENIIKVYKLKHLNLFEMKIKVNEIILTNYVQSCTHQKLGFLYLLLCTILIDKEDSAYFKNEITKFEKKAEHLHSESNNFNQSLKFMKSKYIQK